MARVKRAVHSHKRRRVILARASGYYGNRSRSLKVANESVMKAHQYAYRDRRARKGDFRRLWIQRINAACRQNGTSYSRFISGLKAAEVDIDRKALAELAVSDNAAFASLVQVATGAADGAAPTVAAVPAAGGGSAAGSPSSDATAVEADRTGDAEADDREDTAGAGDATGGVGDAADDEVAAS